MKKGILFFAAVLLVFGSVEGAKKKAGVDFFVEGDTWASTMHSCADKVAGTDHEDSDIERLIAEIYKKFPMETDWFLQDTGEKAGEYFSGDQIGLEYKLIDTVLGELSKYHKIDIDFAMPGRNDGSTSRLDSYIKLCKSRRRLRLKSLESKALKFVFTKHYDLGGSHYAYTEGLSDAQHERHFRPGSALCLLEITAKSEIRSTKSETNSMPGVRITTLLEDKDGVIRDPDVSWDGSRVLFSWKKSDRQDDYHLYEMDLASREIRQLTEGLGYADYEGIYLPDGDILFNSTRCVQIVDCWWTEVSNLYKCDGDGKNIHRISFDQVHTNYPQVMSDGRIIYTRWDYNDRGQLYPQPLFQMNADGTGQTEFYGNNSWFPTTIAHARGIPGTQKVVSILTGHHSHQRGKLAVIDPSKGRQEASGVQIIAPVEETKAVKVDAYGQKGIQYQYPYPLSEDEFVVTYCPLNSGNRRYPAPYAVGFVTADGRRELLAFDREISCNQPVALKAKVKPVVRPSIVDYTRDTGTYYVQDVYIGPGLKGIERGTVKEIRVVALDFRVAGIGNNTNGGPAGGALVSTPVSINNGTWDVKIVLGDAKVYDDGSAFFEVPARRPVYFQALDEKGYVVQSMRSWSTLQPGENFSCVGCHESKDVTPARGTITKAMKAGPQELEPFYGPARGFSFLKEIQPILDKHCVKCHSNREKLPFKEKFTADLKGAEYLLGRESQWRYTFEKPEDGWQGAGFDDSGWGIGKAGFGRKGTPGGKINTGWRSKDIWLRGSFDAAEGMAGKKLVFDVCHDEDVDIYINGLRAAQAQGFVTDYKTLEAGDEAVKAVREGRNIIAVHCRQTVGGQFIDAGVAVLGGEDKAEDKEKPFSLLAEGNVDKRAKRVWSDSYLALTRKGKPNEIVNWLNVQSVPPMLEPYSFGACKSKLMVMLENNHNGVKLSKEELEKIACWIDMLVPYCGDYTEANAWSEKEMQKHKKFMEKRKAMEELDAESIESITN